MEKLIKAKKKTVIPLRASLAALEVGQRLLFPLNHSETSIRNAASFFNKSGWRIRVHRAEKGIIVTRVE